MRMVVVLAGMFGTVQEAPASDADRLAARIERFAGGDDDVAEEIATSRPAPMWAVRELPDGPRRRKLESRIRVAAAAEEDRRYEKPLDEGRIDFKMKDGSVGLAGQMLLDRGIPVAFDPCGLEPPATLENKLSLDRGATYREVLDGICAAIGADYAYRYGLVVVAKPERLWSPTALAAAEWKRLDGLATALGSESLDEREAAAEGLAAFGHRLLTWLKARDGSRDEPEAARHLEQLAARWSERMKRPRFGVPTAATTKTDGPRSQAAVEALRAQGLTLTAGTYLGHTLKVAADPVAVEVTEGADDRQIVTYSFKGATRWSVLCFLTQAVGWDFVVNEGVVVAGPPDEVRALRE